MGILLTANYMCIDVDVDTWNIYLHLLITEAY